MNTIQLIYAFIGALVVICYSWQRFDEPSFPSEETLPHTVDRSNICSPGAPTRERGSSICAAMLLYFLLILPGPQVASLFPAASQANLSETWPLLVALVLVGIMPNTKVEWLMFIERRLRRSVHEFFLVPTEIVRTISVLEYAKYDPPADVLDAIPDSQKEKLLKDLDAFKGSLEYKWARATLLLECSTSREAAAIRWPAPRSLPSIRTCATSGSDTRSSSFRCVSPTARSSLSIRSTAS